MYQLAITPMSSLNGKREYRKSFETKREANKWFKAQESKRSICMNFGAAFSNNTIEVRKLY